MDLYRGMFMRGMLLRPGHPDNPGVEDERRYEAGVAIADDE